MSQAEPRRDTHACEKLSRMALLRRRIRNAGFVPVAYPAWRVWEDRRVRFDDAVLALFTAIRIGRLTVTERAAGARDVHVSDLFSEKELRFREAFQLTVDQAERRWANGQAELAAMSVVMSVSALDDVLGATIKLLRDLGLDTTPAGTVDTGLSAKLRYLNDHGGLNVGSAEIRVHDFCIALRNSLTHHAGSPRPVRAAWDRLGEEEQAWWQHAATHTIAWTDDSVPIALDDRDLLAFFKALDRIGLSVNRQVRERIPEALWAQLVYDEYRSAAPSKAANPQHHIAESTMVHAQKVWRLELRRDVVDRVLTDLGLIRR